MSNRVLYLIKPTSTKTIDHIADASNTGISSWIGKKEKFQMRPIASCFRKLNNSQVNYTTTKLQ